MVSRRNPAALDLLALLARATASRSGATPTLIAAEGEQTAATRQTPSSLLDGDRRQSRPRRRDRRRRPMRIPAEWLLKEAKLPDNVDPVQFRARRPRGAPPHGQGVRARPDQADRLCAAGAALERQAARAALASARNGRPGAASCSSCPATRPSAIACRSARCRTSPPTAYPHVVPLDPLAPRGALPDPSALLRRSAAARDAQPTGARSPPTPATSRTASSRRSREIDGAVRTAVTVEAARRPALRLPAAGRGARGLSRTGRRGRRAARKAIGLPVQIEGYAPPHDPRLNVIRVAPDPGVIEVNIHPASNWDECVATTDGDLRGGAASRARRRQVHDRRPPHRHRRRQPRRGRRRDARRQPVPAPARPAEEPGAALAAPPVAVLPVLRPVHRPDQPGAALRRGAPRQPLRARNRAWRRCRSPAQGTRAAALAGRPAVPQPAGRRHRQHPPLRNLHRQAVIRPTARPAGSAWSSSAASRCRPMRA